LFVAEAKSRLHWYYEVCTGHAEGLFKEKDFKDFLGYAASLTTINMKIEDPANESTYKARGNQIREMAERSVRGRE
jgi:hypothetical protein